jgi:uncharacterized protein
MQHFWEKPGWELLDKQLSGLKKQPFERPLPKIKLKQGLYIIRGPRQIGKSTWLKKMLLTVPASKAFFLSCEEIENYKELSLILNANQDRVFFFLDEISFVKDWWRTIKNILDQNSKVTFVLTGSHAIDLRKGADLMPGRWGEGQELELLPMDFEEYLKIRDLAHWKTESIEYARDCYFRTGGFPFAVIEGGPKGLKPNKAIQVIKKWILGDLAKLGKQEIYLKEIILRIAISTTSKISLQTLAQKTQIGSHNTAQDYIELLESAFAVKTLYFINPETNEYQFKKEKKFYFRDPILFWLAFDWAQVNPPEQSDSMIAETVAHEYIFRKYERFGFYYDRNGEIDFLEPKKWALEIKYSGSISHISKTFLKAQVPQKIIWYKNNFLQKF